MASFTESLLRVLLIKPEDDKPEDYFICKIGSEYVLVRIDNERICCKSIQKPSGWKEWSDTFNFKSILFFLDHVKNPLNRSRIKSFVEANILLLAQNLIARVKHHHSLLHRLFSEELVTDHFNPTQLAKAWRVEVSNMSILTAMTTDFWINKLLGNFQTVYWACSKLKEDACGLDLLNAIQPSYFNLILPAWSIALERNKLPAIQRLDSLPLFVKDSEGNRSSKTPALSLYSKSQGYNLITVQHVLNARNDISDCPAKAEMHLNYLENKAIIKTLRLFEEKNSLFVQSFCSLLDIHQTEVLKKYKDVKLEKVQQELIIQALTQTSAKFKHLTLSSFDALTDPLLLELLKKHGKHLKSIDVSACVSLTDQSLKNIVSSCKKLLILVMNGCNGLINIQNNNFISLTQLYLRGCSNLVSIDLDALRLNKLSTDGCKELKSLAIRSQSLKVLSLKDCFRIKIEVIESVIINPFSLAKIKLHDQLFLNPEIKELIEQYPFLVKWARQLNVRVLQQIVAALKRLEQELGIKSKKLTPMQQQQLSSLLNKLCAVLPKIIDYISKSKSGYYTEWLCWIKNFLDTSTHNNVIIPFMFTIAGNNPASPISASLASHSDTPQKHLVDVRKIPVARSILSFLILNNPPLQDTFVSNFLSYNDFFEILINSDLCNVERYTKIIFQRFRDIFNNKPILDKHIRTSDNGFSKR